MVTAGGSTANTYEAEKARDRESSDPQMFSRKKLRRIAIVAALMLGAFLIGYIPSWLSASGYEYERDQLQRELRLSQVRHDLATAAMSAERGNYDLSLAQASRFFNSLRAESDSPDSVFGPGPNGDVSRMLAQRDEVIAALARKDPAAAEILRAWYFELQKFQPGT